MKMRVIMAVAALALAGCGGIHHKMKHMYPGTLKPQSELAVVYTWSGVDSEGNYITHVDGVSTKEIALGWYGPVAVPAGTHRFKLSVVHGPGLNPEPVPEGVPTMPILTAKFPQLAAISDPTLDMTVEAGKAYEVRRGILPDKTVVAFIGEMSADEAAAYNKKHRVQDFQPGELKAR